ncbi:MAG: hypothetical protein RRY34_06805, partial [Victivallaceae bacterium]
MLIDGKMPIATPIIPVIFVALLLIGGMSLCSMFFQRHEFFFPELLAMILGCTVMARRPWRCSRTIMFISLTLGGVAGFILAGVPWGGIIEKMVLGYALCALFLTFTRSNVTPMLSACLLPILLQNSSWLYPAAIAVEMLLLILAEWMLEKTHCREQVKFEPLPGSFAQRLWRWGKLTAFLIILLYLGKLIGRYAALPPLIVGYSVFADHYRMARKHFFLGVAFMSGAALLGVAARYAALNFALSEVLLQLSAVVILICSCRKCAYILPPCGAALLLIFLLPPAAMADYAWQIPLGSVLFLGAG